MNETQLSGKIQSIVRSVPDTYCQKLSDRFTGGIPDMIIVYKGRFIAIESKVDYRQVTKLQYASMEKIVKAGGRFFVIRYMNKT